MRIVRQATKTQRLYDVHITQLYDVHIIQQCDVHTTQLYDSCVMRTT